MKADSIKRICFRFFSGALLVVRHGDAVVVAEEEAVSADGTYTAGAEVSADSNWYNSRSCYTYTAADRSDLLLRPDMVCS